MVDNEDFEHENENENENENRLTDADVADSEKTIRERIIHVLSIYPKVSTSMLQVGVGTSLMPALWKPVLAQMIVDGIVIEERECHTTPTGRMQTYTVLSLAD